MLIQLLIIMRIVRLLHFHKINYIVFTDYVIDILSTYSMPTIYSLSKTKTNMIIIINIYIFELYDL